MFDLHMVSWSVSLLNKKNGAHEGPRMEEFGLITSR